jgi:outer membrane protein assembly factor BamB
MYKKSSKIISGIIHHYEPSQGEIVAIMGNDRESFLNLISEGRSQSSKIDLDTAYDFVTARDKIVFTNKTASKTYSYDRMSREVKQLSYVLHIKGLRCDKNYFCYSEVQNEERWILISLDSLEILRTYPLSTGFGTVDCFFGDSILSCKKREGIIGRFSLSSGKCIWQTDLKTLPGTSTSSVTSAAIDQIYAIGESIIVVAELLICRLNQSDGRLIWKQDFHYRPVALTFQNSHGYIVTGHHYAVIDLHSGNLLIDKNLEDFTFHQQKLQFDGYGRIYHEGLVWCCLHTNGYYFVAAIYPEDGSVVWLEHVNTRYSIHPPRFHEDKMYILDTGGNLHIYQKSVT